jgi:branched-chain amino acid transport system substrate-binding protein
MVRVPRIERLALVTVALIATACSSGSDSTTPDPSPDFTTTIPNVDSDGVLTFGLLVPQSGDGATLGEPLIAIAEAAVRDINDAGGVLGRPVELVIADEGSDSVSALAALDGLISNDHIDALIGPLSSNLALSVLPRVVEAGVAACSPAATAVALSALPDRDLVIRTSASDGLASQAIAQLVAQTGVTNTVIIYPDDPYGRDLSDAITRSLTLQGISADIVMPFNPSDADYADDASRLAGSSPDVITLVGDRESGGRFLRALLTTQATGTIIVNDAIADVDLSDDPSLISSGSINVVGVALDVRAGSENVARYLNSTSSASTEIPPLAAATIDCFDVIALASSFSGSDAPAEFMPQAIAVSRGGSACATFAECSAIIESGLNFDYNGPTGVLSLDANGDPSVATFVTFGFDETGRSVFRGNLGVFSAP